MTTVRVGSNLVGGTWEPPAGDHWYEDRNPADTREVVGHVPSMSPAQVTAVFDAAEQGAGVWRRTPILSRAGILAGAAAHLRSRATEIAGDVVREMGKTLAEATVEVQKSADFLDYYAGLARTPIGYVLADGRDATEVTVRSEPIGVVLAITPWNDPLLTPARKLGPALISGNAVVLKPSPDTPIAGEHIARALHDAGLPAGVLNTVTGDIDTIGPTLLSDHRIAGVTFTGSTAVGRLLRLSLSDRNIRLQAEMGGKNATVVAADADLELAVATIAAAGFGQSGQRCTATSRVIVERAVADEISELLVQRAAAIRLGSGLEQDTTMGPLVNERQRNGVLGHVERAAAEGAELVYGGAIPTDQSLSHGYFMQPTVLAGVTPEMAIWREEVFGPVVGVTAVEDLDAAIDAVNDSSYGLAASLFTRSLGSAHAFIDRVDTGQVAINLPTSGWDVHEPFGGFSDSGSAFKEQGAEGLAFYTRKKTAAVRFA